MCGIAGILSVFSDKDKRRLRDVERMISLLDHRGPDGRGTWMNKTEKIILGHCRLSVVDLSQAGRQPMISSCGRYTITFNGEIYNYLELMEELKKKGVQFRGHSDTEVLLEGISQWGLDKTLEKITGMFAFGLWDESKKQLILARDRMGKKPLYYANLNGDFYFASEIKALRMCLPSSFFSVDPTALDAYLTLGFIPGERTIYNEVKELPPAHFLLLGNQKRFSLHRYWQISRDPYRVIKFGEAIEILDEILNKAVKIRLRADVPVGIFLSGGIDSSLITAIACRHTNADKIITLTAGFNQDGFDERKDARLVSDLYDTSHQEIVIQSDISKILPHIIRSFDEPLADASAIPSFLIAEQASKKVKVIINGDGGDELFCGYRRHRASLLYDNFRYLFNVPLIENFTSALALKLPVPRSFRTFYAYLYRIIRGIGVSDIDRYISWSSDGFTEKEKVDLYCSDNLILSETFSLPKINDLSFFDYMMFLDLQYQLPNDLLVKMDIATMAHGLEARSPLLDQSIVEYALALPNNIKLPGIRTKPVLRALAQKYLPSEISKKPKKGFEIPLYSWLSGVLYDLVRDMILSNGGLARNIFKNKTLNDILDNKKGLTPARWATVVWILLVLSMWDVYCNRATYSII